MERTRRGKTMENSEMRYDKALKDRGDVINRFLYSERPKNQDYQHVYQAEESTRNGFPDRGDTEQKCKESRPKNDKPVKKLQKKVVREVYVTDRYPKIYSAFERRQLHERYTFRRHNRRSPGTGKNDENFNTTTRALLEYYEVNENKHVKGDTQGEQIRKTANEPRYCGNQKDISDKGHPKISNGSKVEWTIQSKSDLKEKESQKKPVIRTVNATNDVTKKYKAVTFENPRPAFLNVSIPVNLSSDQSRNNISTKVSSTIAEKTSTVTSGQANRRKFSKNKLIPRSPIRQRNKKAKRLLNHTACPPEVPKWDPRCLNKQTKPYYEAWVNKQPTALTPELYKGKFMRDKQNFILNERMARRDGYDWLTADDIDVNDERQTGRIKMTVRPRKAKSEKPVKKDVCKDCEQKQKVLADNVEICVLRE